VILVKSLSTSIKTPLLQDLSNEQRIGAGQVIAIMGGWANLFSYPISSTFPETQTSYCGLRPGAEVEVL
jgi:hypothetical protein